MSHAAVRRLESTDCEVTLDGIAVAAREGETVAAMLLATGPWRPFYCGMGVCYDCTVTIDGVSGKRACLETVSAGMRVETSEMETVNE
jgi:aerobic-type carbon monoxide dehydrogenase small subunit (CoxS/CutS family)